MFTFILHALNSFRGCFSHKRTWTVFCMIVLGFIGSVETGGVTSICRYWGLGESGYNMLLHFFQSSAWSLGNIVSCWGGFVLSQGKLVKVGDRVVLQGDHTHVPKDGRRMPGVVTLHQDSETQSKPSYFRGHCWGAIVGLAGSLSAPFGIPLDLGIHQGFEHLGKKKDESQSETLGTRIVLMAMDFCQRFDLVCILTLDAFFPSKNVFNLANAVWSVKFRKPLVSLIVRAKKNCVAYFEPRRNRSGRGRKRKYGMKVVLTELFDHADMFEKAKCAVYGKTEEISIMAVNLLWRPTGDMIRFVLARTSRGPIVLMCNDLAIDPITALRLYCARSRIEIAFDMLKNLMGAFRYRFWSKGLPLHSRKPKKNAKLKCPGPAGASMVRNCWRRTEAFAMIGAIALGLLQIVSIKYNATVWNHFDAYLRTRSRGIPSERTVKRVLSGFLPHIFSKVASSGVIREIQARILSGGRA
jgi:hypothetical protein